MTTVKMVRFISNEEIIAKITENEDSIVVENAAAIMPINDGQLAMVPWLPHAKEKSIEITKDRVMFMFEPMTELANEYSTKFGSGLVVPPPGAASGLKFAGSET